jgi:thiol:disulfide interchange protein DsbC
MKIDQSVERVERVLARFATSLAVLAITMVAEAAAPPATPAKPDVGATIKQNIESRFPGSHVLDVQPTDISGLYEVFMGDQIVYADSTADHLLIGNLLDTKNKENLTQARFNEHGRIDFKTLPTAQAIKVVKGNGSRTFAVFSDPDCPYCQQLEKSLLSVNDYTMYVYLYPIASLHPQAPVKAHTIWCAPDRAQAWTEWMKDKKLAATNKTCTADPIDSLQKLGDTLHINSTPTLFFANGSRSAGAMPAADLEKALASASKK